MRILTVTLQYPPHHVGGYEVSCRDVMDRLRARGDDVTVLTSDLRRPGVDDPPGERAAGIRRELQPYFRDEALYAPSLWKRRAIERHNHGALVRALDELQPDVVSVWHLGALSTGLLTTLVERDVPMVLVVSDDWLCYGPELDAWMRVWLDHPRLARAARWLSGVPTDLPDDLSERAAVCFISESTRARADAMSRWRFEGAPIVYSGFDPAPFVRAARDHTGAWHGRLLYAGRYDPRKGIETAIRALAALPGTTLEVQGTGDTAERDRLAAIADAIDVGDRVEFGAVARDELPARYAAADAVVFPSEWEEPFGLVPLEAMASGTPVVASGTGGSAEFLVDGENAVLFAPGDAAAFAAAVERLAADPALRRRLVVAGERTAAWFDSDHLADAISAWHTAAAARFRGGRPASRRFDIEAVARG